MSSVGAGRLGMTLVELMIAVALGSMLCLGVATLIVKSQSAYVRDEQTVRLRENGSYALRLLSRELSMVGYFGTFLPSEISSGLPVANGCFPHFLPAASSLEHFDDLDRNGGSVTGSGIPADCAQAGNYQAGSDSLLLRRTLDAPHKLWGRQFAAIEPAALYLQADRSGVALAQGETGSSDSLWQYHPQLLFVRRYSRRAGDGIPALCRVRVSPGGLRLAPVECLVEGVEMLQLQYGLDTDGDMRADRYVSVPSETEASQVMLARIFLLMRAVLPTAGYRNQNLYKVGSVDFQPPGDRFMRRLYSTSVLMRNSEVFRG